MTVRWVNRRTFHEYSKSTLVWEHRQNIRRLQYDETVDDNRTNSRRREDLIETPDIRRLNFRRRQSLETTDTRLQRCAGEILSGVLVVIRPPLVWSNVTAATDEWRARDCTDWNVMAALTIPSYSKQTAATPCKTYCAQKKGAGQHLDQSVMYGVMKLQLCRVALVIETLLGVLYCCCSSSRTPRIPRHLNVRRNIDDEQDLQRPKSVLNVLFKCSCFT